MRERVCEREKRATDKYKETTETAGYIVRDTERQRAIERKTDRHRDTERKRHRQRDREQGIFEGSKNHL